MSPARPMRMHFPLLPRLLTFAAGLLPVLGASGCFSLSKEHVAKRRFVMEIERSAATTEPSAGVLVVRPFQGTPGFEGPGLVYRLGDARYESDFFNEFFVAPTTLVSVAARRWLTRSGLFHAVIEPGGLADPEYLLDGSVVRMHGDYRDRKDPRAVIEVQLLVTRQGDLAPTLLFHRNYTEVEGIPKDRPEELIVGWNRALERILASFEEDLRAVLAESSAE